MRGELTRSRPRQSPADRASKAPPTVQERILYTTLMILGVVGLFSFSKYNALPANTIISAAIFFTAALLIPKLSRGASLLLLAVAYLGFKAMLMFFYRPANVWDFMQAYQAYVYLVPLALFVGQNLFDRRRMATVTKVLLFLVLTKYLVASFLVPPGPLTERPGLFYENNYELFLLLGLFYLSHPAMGRFRHLLLVVLVGVVFLSGSRSAMLGTVVVFASLYLRRHSRYYLFSLIGMLLLGSVAMYLISQRSGGTGIESVDRYRFLLVFLAEVREWPDWQFLVGSLPLTPLSTAGCHELQYWEGLFSREDPRTCYAVILHSFFLRAIFDQGLIGVLFVFWWVWHALTVAGRSRRDRVTVLALAAVNAMSVSSFNSEYVVLVVLFALALREDRPGSGGEETPDAPVSTGTSSAARHPGRARPSLYVLSRRHL